MSVSPSAATSYVGSKAQNDFNGEQLSYTVKKEGLAEIRVACNDTEDHNKIGRDEQLPAPKRPITAQASPQSVFYNPIQRFNRDLSVLAVKAFAEDWAAFKNQTGRSRRGDPSSSKHSGNRKRKREAEDENTAQAEEHSHTSAASLNRGSVGSPNLPAILPDTNPLDEKTVQIEEGAGLKSREESVSKKETFGDEHEDPKTGNAVDHDQLIEHALPATSRTKQPFLVLDALSATGLRALRYALEVPEVTSVNANDLSPSAIESVKQNILHNGLERKITTTRADAIEHMYSVATRAPSPKRLYQVIDLDPYGTATPFLDAAIQAIANGGLLCVTCTDAGVFASVGYLEKCFSQYGGLPLKGPHAHEAGIRLILHALATSAARYGISIEPLLSLSIDFYARVFVRVRKSPADVKLLASKTMFVYNCDQGCGAWETQFLAQARPKENKNGELLFKFTSALGPEAERECEHCGFRTHLAGPMWGGPLHNPLFIERILDMLPNLDQNIYQTVERIEGVLSTMLEECFEDPWASKSRGQDERTSDKNTDIPNETIATPENDDGRRPQREVQDPNVQPHNRPIPPMPTQYRTNHPFFIHPPHLARALNVPTPSDRELRGALRHLGYRATRSHTKPGSIATDAPWCVVWEIMREWIRQKGIHSSPKPGTVAWRIMQKDRRRGDMERFKEELTAKVGAAQTAEQVKTELEAGLGRLSSLISRHGRRDGGSGDFGNQLRPDSEIDHISIPPPRSTHEFSDANKKDNGEQAAAATFGLADANAVHTLGVSGIDFGSSRDRSMQRLHALTIDFDEQLGTDRPIMSEIQRTKAGVDAMASKGKNKRTKTITRYQVNPANWGPLTRARGR